MEIDTWPVTGGSSVVIRGYRGDTYQEVIDAFHRDAVLLLEQGYVPAGQHYAEGQWSIWRGLLATLTIWIIIGALLWTQMLTSRPIGVLTVTYVNSARVGSPGFASSRPD